MQSKISISPTEEAIVDEILDGILNETFELIQEKFYKLKSVALYHESFVEALKDILYVYEKPKPCNDHSHIIEAWKRDKPAKPLAPDSLMREFVK